MGKNPLMNQLGWGAYWHNDFGRQRSHGCVNVLPDAAQWVYRWTRPITAYEDALVEVKNGGTRIVVTWMWEATAHQPVTLLSDQPSTRLLINAPASLQRAAWRALLANRPGIATGIDLDITEIGNCIFWLLAEASHTT